MNRNATFFGIILILIGVVVASGIILGQKNAPLPEKISDEEIRYAISPVTDDDHILGNPEAEVIFIEYADFKCSFCREFHSTMEKLVEEFGKNGDLAWVYRHFPREDALQDNNSLSTISAVAAECVADIGGEPKFWQFVSKVNQELPASFTQDDLEDVAMSLSIEKEKYDECLADQKFRDKIKKSIEDGLIIYKYDSDFGTPYTIIVTQSGDQVEMIGAQDFSYLKEIVSQLLNKTPQ
ncbi:MAG TPA: thioredoxin domain-containing protein [Candidatus Paceibacterota bacterium]|nr:thioredoxin domain-containing protein [Candidatus Paceibacterota bacterium]HRZ34511.1 thioredoxin domain-containing protein [Candidatus Paceibacterota bacterium]